MTLTGQHGGKGGNGTHTSGTAASSSGGDGGKGGTVLIQALGRISIGPGSLIKTGDGGAGGSAIADGSSGHGGTVGASGTATGGGGGAPGLFSAVAKTGNIAFNGAMNLQIGTGGRGGNASAIGGDGRDAEPCPAAAGGFATATAGSGGTTPDKTLTAGGAVTGSGNLTVTGGIPGAGGNATSTSGKGGAGAQLCKPGAVGGAPTAKGGKGGDANLKNQSGTKVANGGNGGNMEVGNGKGGAGWNDCVLPTFEAGGAGGKGGSIAGFNGAFGTGFADGSAGAATYTTVANGGNGGSGVPAGAAGAKGDNAVVLNGGVAPTTVAPSLQPGLAGVTCAGISLAVSSSPLVVAQGAQGTVSFSITRTGSFTGTVTVELKDQGGTVRGTRIVASGSTTGGVTFTVPVTEPDGNRTWTLTASGSNVADVTKNVPLIVTGAGGLVNVTIQNKDQVNNPWTTVVSKVGAGSHVSHPIAPNGSATLPVPGTNTPVTVVVQGKEGSNQVTSVYEMGSIDLIRYAAGLGKPARASITFDVIGLPANRSGTVFAGDKSAAVPANNTDGIPLSGVQAGVPVVAGCTRSNAELFVDAVFFLGASIYMGGENIRCDFNGGGTVFPVPVQQTVTGESPGTPLSVTGGVVLGGIHTTMSSRSFMAPSTSYPALRIQDLPSGALPWLTLAKSTPNSYQGTTWYYPAPQDWTTPLPPLLSQPTVSINSIFNNYYEFWVSLPIQLALLGAWYTEYAQANNVGGLNLVRHLVTRSFFLSSVASPMIMRTPTSLLFDLTYMPRPGAGPVDGRVCAYSFNLFVAVVTNSVLNEVCKLGVPF
jgi:hypothetical protein